MIKNNKNLTNVYSYKNMYFNSPEQLIKQIREKTIIPHQVEIQPGPKSNKLCWLDCPYCYGGSSKMSSEALDDMRYIDVLKEIAVGKVNKLIFAGYATDPLNYKFIANLTQVPLEYNQIMGFHTKAIKVSNSLLMQLGDKNLKKGSYFSVSVDAGSVETYNIVHGLDKNKTTFYNKVVENFGKINEIRKINNNPLDLSATYLLNEHNSSIDEVKNFIKDFKNAGADILRFTFPQKPRGYVEDLEGDKDVPERNRQKEIYNNLKTLIESENSNDCNVIIIDYDTQMNIHDTIRTLPCFAQWIFPSIGYDGHLYHCSESSAPHFRSFSLGNLNNNNFWDLFYDYDTNNLNELMSKDALEKNKHDCRCDRKEHTVNQIMKNYTF